MREMTPKPAVPPKPKFRVGQVVSVNSYYGNFQGGQTGPGFKGRHGWRHGFEFGKIVKILEDKNCKPAYRFSYFLDGWMSANCEKHLRPLTKKEIR